MFSFDADEVRSVTFAFDEAITGFSANWSNTFVQAGFRVSSPFNDYDLNGLSGDLNDQFIGFTEDAAFDTVTFTTTEPLGDDFVFFSEFDFGGAPAAVPEPGTFALLAVAAAGGVIRRRRRAASRGLTARAGRSPFARRAAISRRNRRQLRDGGDHEAGAGPLEVRGDRGEFGGPLAGGHGGPFVGGGAEGVAAGR